MTSDTIYTMMKQYLWINMIVDKICTVCGEDKSYPDETWIVEISHLIWGIGNNKNNSK